MADYMHSRVVIRKKEPQANDWVSEANGIVVDATDIQVSKGLGKKRDSFKFSVRSPNNSLYETFFDGDGSTKVFTLKWSPIPTTMLSGGTQKLLVYISDVLQEYTTHYSVSGSTLTFVNAPADADRNIRVVFPVIEADDIVDIYFWENDTWSGMSTAEKNAARVEEGRITEPNVNKGKNVVGVRGFGSMDIIFSGMAFALSSESNVYAHTIIQGIIAQLNQFNPNRPIYGQDATEWTNIGNSTVTTKTSYSSKYKPAIEMIEELSRNEHTHDGQYIYWVEYDSTNDRYDFHWKAKSATSTSTITEGTDPIVIKASRSTDDVVNVIIANVGNDCYGNGQEYLYYDFTITGYGARWRYISATDTITQNLINKEFEANASKWLTGNDDERKENFPDDYDSDGNGYWEFEFTPRTSMSDPTYSDHATENVTTDAGFNEIIRRESYWQGKAATMDIIHLYSNPRFKANLTIKNPNSSTWTLGDIYELALPCFNLDNKKLRLVQIDYEFYHTILHLEEDEQTLEE